MTAPVLFSGRSRGALIHVLDHRSKEPRRTVAVCGAWVGKVRFHARGRHTCSSCTLVHTLRRVD